jgi:putative MFS transporter
MENDPLFGEEANTERNFDVEYEISLDTALTRAGYGKFQIYLLFLCGIGFAAGTVELVLISILIPEVHKEFDLTSEKDGLLASSLFFGEIIGGFIFGYISDNFGRRFAFLLGSFLSAVMGSVSSLSDSFLTLTLMRFFLGVTLGGSLSIDFIYFIENLPALNRGYYSAFIIPFGIVGVIFTSVVGWLIIPLYGWRIFLLICSLPCFILTVLRILWKWESPRYLYSQEKYEEAIEVIRKMALMNNGEELPHFTLIPLNNGSDIDLVDCERRSHSKVSFFKKLKSYIDSKERRKILFLLFCLWFCITFGYYGITFWLGKYLESKKDSISVYKNFFIMGIAEIPGWIFSLMLLERIGRPKTLGITLALCSISCILFGLTDSQVTAIIFSSLMYFCIVGSWTCIYIYTNEVFPTCMRTVSFSVANMGGGLAGILTGPVIIIIFTFRLAVFFFLFLLIIGG